MKVAEQFPQARGDPQDGGLDGHFGEDVVGVGAAHSVPSSRLRWAVAGVARLSGRGGPACCGKAALSADYRYFLRRLTGGCE